MSGYDHIPQTGSKNNVDTSPIGRSSKKETEQTRLHHKGQADHKKDQAACDYHNKQYQA